MNRAELRALPLALLVLGALAMAFVVGCGAGDPATEAPPRETAPVEANMSPLPDFHSYVVGDLPEPALPSRDPFHGTLKSAPTPAPRVATPPTPRPVTLQLQGIMQRQGRPVALFAQGSAGVGDTVAGWEVISIERNQVVLERGGRRRTLSL